MATPAPSSTSWVSVCFELCGQIQKAVSGFWFISYGILGNLHKMDEFKQVIERFNVISFDPLSTRVQQLGVKLYIDEINNRVYATEADGMLLDAAGQLFSTTTTISMVYKKNSYLLTRSTKEVSGVYVFHTIKGPYASTQTDGVQIGGFDAPLSTVTPIDDIQSGAVEELKTEYILWFSSPDHGCGYVEKVHADETRLVQDHSIVFDRYAAEEARGIKYVSLCVHGNVVNRLVIC